jgi:hypothetical protein
LALTAFGCEAGGETDAKWFRRDRKRVRIVIFDCSDIYPMADCDVNVDDFSLRDP